MIRTLRILSYLSTLVSGLFLVLLLIGLAMEARPEIAGWLQLSSTERSGLALALVGGIGALGSAILGQILNLIRGTIGDESDIVAH